MNSFVQPAARVTLLLLLAAVLLAGCTQRSPTIAPITTAQDARPAYGKFVWHDLLTEDVEGVKRFYGELLGWTFTATELASYTLVEHRGRPIGGIVDMTAVAPDSNQSQWISLLSVPDVARAVDETSHAGGQVHVQPTKIRGRGTLAVVSDPRGAVVGYLRATGGDPPDRKADLGDFLWTELWTDDVVASYGFYRDLVGYNLEEEIILEDQEYTVFKRDGVPRAGVIGPVDEIRSNWLPYVRVDDPAKLAARVEELGGKLFISPAEDVRTGTVAVILDPSGAAVALQKWGES